VNVRLRRSRSLSRVPLLIGLISLNLNRALAKIPSRSVISFVMSRNPCRQLLAGLALFALAWAQSVGVTRGYLCDCGGEVEVTQVDHCHGPHSVRCHDDEATDHHHQHPDLPAEDDTHQHAPVKETVLANQVGSKALTSITPPMELVTTLEVPTVRLPLEQAHVVASGLLRDDGGGGRLWPRMLAHAIALRI
jgi:hypothetical protein